jgi:acetyl-CoA C-acetyltransferase
MRRVSIVGIGQVPVKQRHESGLRKLGAAAVRAALADAGIETVDALYAGNMLSDELQGQKHVASLIADEAGLAGIEALEVKAATASGAAALRVGYLTVAGGAAERVVVVGAEKMSDGAPTTALAKSLDAHREVRDGATMLSHNARLMQLYLERYRPPAGALAHFAVNAHHNACANPNALYCNRGLTVERVMASREISPPLRLLDCAPICDGAAAVILAPASEARQYTTGPVDILSSAVATDRFRLADRPEPLRLVAAERSVALALARAGVTAAEIDFFELHDAFTIMSCLALEAAGFARPGEGWRLAVEGEIRREGSIPITTLGGLKARGHPIGASALYQACEAVIQLRDQAGPGQVPGARLAMMQSVGGVAATIITHILGRG